MMLNSHPSVKFGALHCNAYFKSKDKDSDQPTHLFVTLTDSQHDQSNRRRTDGVYFNDKLIGTSERVDSYTKTFSDLSLAEIVDSTTLQNHFRGGVKMILEYSDCLIDYDSVEQYRGFGLPGTKPGGPYMTGAELFNHCKNALFKAVTNTSNRRMISNIKMYLDSPGGFRGDGLQFAHTDSPKGEWGHRDS